MTKQYYVHINTSCTSSPAVVHDKPHDTESEASSSKNVNEQSITHSDGIMAEGSSMEYDDDADKQSDMDTREQEEGQDVEM